MSGAPAEDASWIDKAADRFESAWNAGERPRIEDHLAEAPESQRPDLLAELLRVERELRQRALEKPSAEEYRKRFPEYAHVIEGVFGPAPAAQPARPEAAADRNLLFGILALQMDFISRDALIAAMHAWVLNKSKPLGRILVEQGALGDARHDLLAALVQEHLKQHGNDPEQSLAALSSLGPVRADLKAMADPDLQASLPHVSAARVADEDPDATRVHTAGTSTSTGGRFRILRLHAKGGLGEVHVAHDEEVPREVALKQIQQDYADDPDSRARFVMEAEITGGLEHPGIVPVYGLGHYADGRPFYAMRFIKGDSLKDAIHWYHQGPGSKLTPGERAVELQKLLRRFLDVCNAIEYAHSRGVLHRDLKPGNIMVGKYGETMVVDWGLAKAVGRPEIATTVSERTLRPASGSGVALTRMGDLLGTLPYMSPEQAEGRIDLLGRASDVYSLGATLYSLLTGRPPFQGENPEVMRTQVRQGLFPPPRQVNRHVAPALEAICLKAMALEAGKRYASPRALAHDVEHWMADEAVSALRESLSQRLARWARRHRTWVQAGLASLVLISVVSLVWVTVLRTSWKHEAAAHSLVRESLRKETAALDREQRMRRLAEAARFEAQHQLAKVFVEQGMSAYQQGDVARGLFSLAASLEKGSAEDRHFQHLVRSNLSAWSREVHSLRLIIVHDQLGPVLNMAFSPDGKSLLTGSSDKTAQLWDVASGMPLGKPMRHEGAVYAVAFSHDGRTILTGSEDQSARLWDAVTNSPVGRIMKHQSSVMAVAFSPVGGVAVTGGDEFDETVHFWNPATGAPQGQSLWHPGNITATAFSPDGKTLITVCRSPWLVFSASENVAQLWDAATHERLGDPMRHQSAAIWCAAFSPDGRIVATGGSDNTARLWNVITRKQIGPDLRHKGPVWSISFSPDGRTVATASEETGRVWEVATGQLIGQPLLHQNTIRAICFSPDGKDVATGSVDKTVRIWRTSRSVPPTPAFAFPSLVNCVAFSLDGHRFATAGGAGAAELWDVTTEKAPHEVLMHNGPLRSVEFSPSGTTLLVKSTEPHAMLLELSKTPPRPILRFSYDPKVPIVFSPDGRIIAAKVSDRSIQLWETSTGRPLSRSPCDQNFCRYLGFSCDSKRLITADLKALRLWDVATGALVGEPMGLRDKGIIQCVAISPDCKTAVVGKQNGTTVWEIDSQKPAARADIDTYMPISLRFSPSGTTLLSQDLNGEGRILSPVTGRPIGKALTAPGSSWRSLYSPNGKVLLIATGNAVRAWDAATATPLSGPMTPPAGQSTNPFNSGTVPVAFSPDGEAVLIGSADGTARLWDPIRGLPTGNMMPHRAALTSVAFSPDGETLLTACTDGSLRIWDRTSGHPIGSPMLTPNDGEASSFGAIDASFSGDGRYIVATSPKEYKYHGGSALVNAYYIWEIPAPVDASALTVSLWVKSVTGMESDGNEAIHAIGFRAWQDYGEQLHRSAFSPTVGRGLSDSELSWHQYQAAINELAGRWYTVVWHLDRLVARRPREWMSYLRRARAHAELGLSSKAKVDYEQAIEAGADRRLILRVAQDDAERGLDESAAVAYLFADVRSGDQHAWHMYLLSRLRDGDIGSYRIGCADLLAKFGTAPKTGARNDLAWSCVLGPDALDDLSLPVKWSESEVAVVPTSARLNTLGAALYRAGRHEEAIHYLNLSLRQPDNRAKPFDWLFLAMAHHSLGQGEEARKWFGRVEGKSTLSSLSGRTRLEFEVLLREAETMIREGRPLYLPSRVFESLQAPASTHAPAGK